MAALGPNLATLWFNLEVLGSVWDSTWPFQVAHKYIWDSTVSFQLASGDTRFSLACAVVWGCLKHLRM